MGIAFGIRFAVGQHQPQWPWIGAALVACYVVFGGLSLIFGLDDDDKMIMTAVRDRIWGAIGK